MKKNKRLFGEKELTLYFNFDGRLKKIGDNYGNGILFWYINGFRWIEKLHLHLDNSFFFNTKIIK